MRRGALQPFPSDQMQLRPVPARFYPGSKVSISKNKGARRSEVHTPAVRPKSECALNERARDVLDGNHRKPCWSILTQTSSVRRSAPPDPLTSSPSRERLNRSRHPRFCYINNVAHRGSQVSADACNGIEAGHRKVCSLHNHLDQNRLKLWHATHPATYSAALALNQPRPGSRRADRG